MTYIINITGTGTASQIVSRLYEIAAHAHNKHLFGEDIQMKSDPEDNILIAEIKEEWA
jgi:hypothetical protein